MAQGRGLKPAQKIGKLRDVGHAHAPFWKICRRSLLSSHGRCLRLKQPLWWMWFEPSGRCPQKPSLWPYLGFFFEKGPPCPPFTWIAHGLLGYTGLLDFRFRKKSNCVQWVFNVRNFWGKCHLDPYIVCRMCPSSLLMPWCILVLIPVLIPMAFRNIDAQTMRPMKIPASITASQCVPAPENWKSQPQKSLGKRWKKDEKVHLDFKKKSEDAKWLGKCGKWWVIII